MSSTNLEKIKIDGQFNVSGVGNDFRLFPSSLRHIMLQYIAFLQASSWHNDGSLSEINTRGLIYRPQRSTRFQRMSGLADKGRDHIRKIPF